MAAARSVVDDGNDPRPTLRAGLWLYFSLLGLSTATIIALKAVPAINVDGAMELTLSGLFAVIVVAFGCFHAKSVVRLLRPVGSWQWYAVALVAPVGTFLFAGLVLKAFHDVLGTPLLNEVEGFETNGYGFATAVLAVCVLPAVSEEIAFRGMIFDGLARHLSVTEAALVSMVMFGILHLSVISLPHLLLIGLVLAALRIKSGSLLPGIIAHFLHNLLVCSSHWFHWRLPW
ncbi:MAG: type II CAAX endopeptidase family protein [Tepidisphaeraceae bacterium]